MKKVIQSLCLLALLLFSSCATERKNMIYLQDMDETEEYPVIQKYEAVIQRDDKLSITVSCKNPELAIAFNLPNTGGGFEMSSDGTVKGGTSNNTLAEGYLVDVEGNIDFPILGILHVEGLTRKQLTDLIKGKLVERELLKDPIVQVNFLNFKFSTLGEIHNGTFQVAGDRITILEAIAMAGGMLENSKIEHVAVVRDFGNKRRIMHVDLRSKDIFLSPAFYLHQNDIIYVEPNGIKSQERVQRRYQFWTSLITSLSGTVAVVLYFCKK